MVNACSAGDPGLISGSERSPREGNGNPHQYSCLENPIDRGAWLATVHGVAKSRTWLKQLRTHANRILVPWPGIEPASLMSPALAGRFFTTVPPGKPQPQPKCLLLTVTFMVYRVGFNFMFVYLLQNIAWLHFSSFINVSSTGKYESCLLTYKKTFFSKGLQFIFLHQ